MRPSCRFPDRVGARPQPPSPSERGLGAPVRSVTLGLPLAFKYRVDVRTAVTDLSAEGVTL